MNSRIMRTTASSPIAVFAYGRVREVCPERVQRALSTECSARVLEHQNRNLRRLEEGQKIAV
jgi:hypothetical protein